MSEIFWLSLVAVLAVLAVAIAALLLMARMTRRNQVAIDRLLLLGRSSTVGEAIAAYERLNRVERARGELEAQLARRGERVKGATQQDGTDVARKEERGRGWFGYRRPPKRDEEPPTGG